MNNITLYPFIEEEVGTVGQREITMVQSEISSGQVTGTLSLSASHFTDTICPIQRNTLNVVAPWLPR